MTTTEGFQAHEAFEKAREEAIMKKAIKQMVNEEEAKLYNQIAWLELNEIGVYQI